MGSLLGQQRARGRQLGVQVRVGRAPDRVTGQGAAALSPDSAALRLLARRGGQAGRPGRRRGRRPPLRRRPSRPRGERGKLAGAARQGGAASGGGDGSRSNSSMPSSTAASPSTIAWWTLPSTAAAPPGASCGITSSCHSGRSRGSWPRQEVVGVGAQAGGGRPARRRPRARGGPGRTRGRRPRSARPGRAARAATSWRKRGARCSRAARLPSSRGTSSDSLSVGQLEMRHPADVHVRGGRLDPQERCVEGVSRAIAEASSSEPLAPWDAGPRFAATRSTARSSARPSVELRGPMFRRTSHERSPCAVQHSGHGIECVPHAGPERPAGRCRGVEAPPAAAAARSFADDRALLLERLGRRRRAGREGRARSSCTSARSRSRARRAGATRARRERAGRARRGRSSLERGRACSSAR